VAAANGGSAAAVEANAGACVLPAFPPARSIKARADEISDEDDDAADGDDKVENFSATVAAAVAAAMPARGEALTAAEGRLWGALPVGFRPSLLPLSSIRNWRRRR
jgi:hypothetical protein